MNGYREKHGSSQPWAVASTASPGYRGKHRRKNRRRRRRVTVLLILLFLCLCYPFVEAHLLMTDRVTLKSEDLPADIGNLRIVFVTDIHYGYFFSDAELNSLVSRINQLKPDIVLFGGGYATDHASAVRFFRNLPSIHARYAIAGVIGETDRGETPAELSRLQDVMRDAGVIPLVNEVYTVRIGNSAVCIAGLDDPLSGTPDLKTVASRVSASDYVVLLCHSPSVIPDTELVTDSADRLGWFDLGLFGHTHGGQMALFSPILDLASEVPERYRSGWLKENRIDLLISNGVGTLEFPARLFCYPQIHDINITAD